VKAVQYHHDVNDIAVEYKSITLPEAITGDRVAREVKYENGGLKTRCVVYVPVAPDA
jgi:hypothetical protein